MAGELLQLQQEIREAARLIAAPHERCQSGERSNCIDESGVHLPLNLEIRIENFLARSTPYRLAVSNTSLLDFDVQLREQYDFPELSPERGQILQTLYLSGVSLRNKDFNFQGAQLTNATLNEVDLSNYNLDGANFDGAQLTDAKFINASLAGAHFSKAVLDRALFPNANLTNANFSGASIIGTVFSHTLMDGTIANADTLVSVTETGTIIPNFDGAFAWSDKQPRIAIDALPILLCPAELRTIGAIGQSAPCSCLENPTFTSGTIAEVDLSKFGTC